MSRAVPLSPDERDVISARERRVLLVTGASGCGKSTLARALATGTGADIISVDDIRVAIEAVAEGDLGTAFLISRVARETLAVETGTDDAAAQTIARRVSSAIARVVLMRAAYGGRTIIEGDALLPSMLGAPPVAQLVARGLVVMVLLDAPDAGQLGVRLRARRRGFAALSEALQANEVARQCRRAQQLRHDANTDAAFTMLRIDAGLSVAEACDKLRSATGWRD